MRKKVTAIPRPSQKTGGIAAARISESGEESPGRAKTRRLRVVQGAGAAIIYPTALAIPMNAFPVRERGRSMAIFFALAGGLLDPISAPPRCGRSRMRRRRTTRRRWIVDPTTRRGWGRVIQVRLVVESTI
jgi:hypothetical protein